MAISVHRTAEVGPLALEVVFLSAAETGHCRSHLRSTPPARTARVTAQGRTACIAGEPKRKRTSSSARYLAEEPIDSSPPIDVLVDPSASPPPRIYRHIYTRLRAESLTFLTMCSSRFSLHCFLLV